MKTIWFRNCARHTLSLLISAYSISALKAPEFRPIQIVVAPSYAIAAMSRSIAFHEGSGVPGSIATRLHNPGCLIYAGQLGATRDRSGYAEFADEASGRAALKGELARRFGRGLALGQVMDAWAAGIYLPQLLRETGLDRNFRIRSSDR